MRNDRESLRDEGHDRLVRAVEEGTISIGVDRPFARRLFTDVPIVDIESAVGRSVWAVVFLVRVAFLAPLILYIAAVGKSDRLDLPKPVYTWDKHLFKVGENANICQHSVNARVWK